MRCKYSVLLLSDTGEGKTTQIGFHALWHFKKTGGYVDPKTKLAVGGERTVLYSGDFGGWAVIQPLIDLGIVEVVDLTQHVNTFDWLDKIAACKLPVQNAMGQVEWVLTDKVPGGPHKGAAIGPRAYDSGTTYAHLLMNNLSNGDLNVGGGGGMKFKQGDFEFATNTQAHYGIAQQAVLKAVAKSQISTSGPILWSFRLRRSEGESGQQIIGPQIAGGALTPELPGWFSYTFRLVKSSSYGQPTEVSLFLDHHVDASAPQAKVLANGRTPIGAKAIEPKQTPAHVPQMLEKLMAASDEALDTIMKACPPPTSQKTMAHTVPVKDNKDAESL